MRAGCALSAERRANASDRLERLLQHQLRGQPHDAPPQASESPIAPSIGRPTASVSGAIDLDDELGRRRSKSATKRHLVDHVIAADLTLRQWS